MTNEVIRADDGRFASGVSGNPLGRPKGKKNVITELKQDLEIAIRSNVDPNAISKIVNKMILAAQDGNVGAAKLILDKVLSNAKEAEDAFDGSGGITVIVKNATIQAERNEEKRTIIDITPEESKMSTGASKNNQSRSDQSGGGQIVGKAPSARLHKAPNFQGKSGQGDNQSTRRPKGST